MTLLIIALVSSFVVKNEFLILFYAELYIILGLICLVTLIHRLVRSALYSVYMDYILHISTSHIEEIKNELNVFDDELENLRENIVLADEITVFLANFDQEVANNILAQFEEKIGVSLLKKHLQPMSEYMDLEVEELKKYN